jgi:hypothetical protein
MQSLLDLKAREAGRSVVDHLRFRLRSIFELALSEGVVHRNPAVRLFTPRDCRAGRDRLVLTPEQAVTMIGALDIREKVIARLATWEGMRPGEILALQFGTSMAIPFGFAGGSTREILMFRKRGDPADRQGSRLPGWGCSRSGRCVSFGLGRTPGCSRPKTDCRYGGITSGVDTCFRS